MNRISYIAILLSMAFLAGKADPSPRYSFVEFLQEYLDIKYSGRNFNEYLYVSVKKQRLYHIKNGQVVEEYIISTSSKGVGAHENSEKTPPGLHIIKTKIGDNVPVGGVFDVRTFSGRMANIETRPVSTRSDDVTTRILWLSGEEEGVNRGGKLDSYNRNIYIHGTPEEGLLGTPASHGCVRMKNDHIAELYDKVAEGTPVIILNN